jgi:hypothetical protein
VVRRQRSAVISRASLVGFCLFLLIQSCATTLGGRITDSSGNPVYHPDGRINVLSVSGGAITNQILEIDENGHFETSDVQAGARYIVEALVPGYTTISKTFDFEVSQECILKVEAIGEPEPKSIGTNDDVNFDAGAGQANLMPPPM